MRHIGTYNSALRAAAAWSFERPCDCGVACAERAASLTTGLPRQGLRATS